MRSSCNMHDDHFLLVCFLQGFYSTSAGVLCRFLHAFGSFWSAQHICGSFGQDAVFLKNRIFESFYQVRKFFFIGIPRLVGFASYFGVQKIVHSWLMVGPYHKLIIEYSSTHLPMDSLAIPGFLFLFKIVFTTLVFEF